MGFKICWMAVQGVGKDELLSREHLQDTGRIDEAQEAPWSGAQLPDGWFLLWSNRFDDLSADRLARLSSGGRLVGCQVHEGVMESLAVGYSDGQEVWAVSHDSDRGPTDLTVRGRPPAGFKDIRMRLLEEQRVENLGEALVDYVVDIPIELANSICGYRHDRWKFDWGQPNFTELEPKAK
jgi:hypothetical protein